MSPELVERVAEAMHNRYETVAAAVGWATNPESRKPWADVPEPNKQATREIARWALALAERAAREQALSDGFERDDEGAQEAVRRAVELA